LPRPLLSADLPHSGILHHCVRSGNIPAEQLHPVPFSAGAGRNRLRTDAANVGGRGEGVPTIHQKVTRVQVLAGSHKGNVRQLLHDLLRGVRCASVLAHFADVLWGTVLHDHEETGCAHVQAQVRTD